MRRILTIVAAGLLIVAVAGPAPAFELNVKGTWLWGYDYIDQAGRAGFFGAYDTASAAVNAGTVKFNTMNSWVGARAINGQQYGMVTGADASLQWMRAELRPDIEINRAVRLRGVYQIGSGTSEYGLYANNSAFGAYNVIASGTWTQWWGTAETPWGILIGGKRPFTFGMGAQYDGSSCSSESFGIVSNYGPFRFGFVCYPWRGQTWVNSMAGRQVVSTTLGAGPQANTNAALTLVEAYRLWDNDRKRGLQPGAFFTYSSGSIDAGAVYEWWPTHNGPGGATTNGNALLARTYDAVYEDGSAYVKFNNGRFFLNTEIGWFRAQQHVTKAQTDVADFTDGGGSLFAPYFVETWKYMAELGLISGPAKMSLLFSWVPGPDRRHGIWINKQSWENIVNGTFLGNAQAFLPYSMIMSYQYGSGLNALNRNGEGYMTDAISYGGRLDYALAANLNVYGTFFYANRQSKGWPLGCLDIADDGTNGGGRVLLLGQQVAPATGVIMVAPQNLFGAPGPVPNIPDDSLGWEVTAGADWKLLEGLTARLRGGYWQVGNWFKYACVDKTRSTGGQVTVGGITRISVDGTGPFALAVNPDRAIDPIWMFQGIMAMDF